MINFMVYLYCDERVMKWKLNKVEKSRAEAHLFICLGHVGHPSKHETFRQCRYNVGPSSSTLALHFTNISMIRLNVSCLLGPAAIKGIKSLCIQRLFITGAQWGRRCI